MINQALQFKVIVVGEQGVGKSSLLYQYSNNEFQSSYKVTIGVEFVKAQVQVDRNSCITLQIWDTAGQESFKSMVRSFYRGAAAVILVYNITKAESLFAIEHWLKEVRENAHSNIVSVLVGNQCDLDERKISHDDGVQFMQDNNIDLFFETSAKSGENVRKAFEETSKLIFLRFLNNLSYKQSITSSKKTTPQMSRHESQQSAKQPHRRGISNLQQHVNVIDEDEKELDTTRHNFNQNRSIKLSNCETTKPTENKKKNGCC